MNIFINGKDHQVTTSNLQEVIESKEFKPPFAVAINKVFIPNHLYTTTHLEDGDRLDVVSPIYGG